MKRPDLTRDAIVARPSHALSRHRMLTATAASVVGLSLVLAGCSGDSNGDKPSGDADRTQQLVDTTPAGDGDVETLTWALPNGEPGTLDPAKSGTDPSNTVVVNMCDSLLRLEPDWSISEGLATSADWTDDTTFVIKLRDDATFWDGTPVTAEDVAFSLSRQMDPATQAVNIGAFIYVKDISATGDDEVTVTFKQHDSMFRNSMVTVAGEVIQKAYAESKGADFGTATGGVMCSGAFEFVKWTSGESIQLKANENWWGGNPQVKNIEFKFIADDSTLTSALASGEIDGSYDVPQGSMAALEKSDGKLYLGPATSSISVSPTTDDGPAADPRVREALDLAIDKEAFIKNQLFGAGKLQKTLTPELSWSGDPAADIYREGYEALPSAERDLDRAKELIAEAAPEDKELTIALLAGDQLTLQVATLTQAAGKELGLNIKIKQMQPTDFGNLFYTPEQRESVDFVATAGYQESPGAVIYAPLFAIPGQIFNWSGYDNPEVTKLLTAARAATDPDEVANEFVAAQAIFAPDRLQISFANIYNTLYMNNRITGAPASMSWISAPWAASIGAANNS